jgi:hypothetical protein
MLDGGQNPEKFYAPVACMGYVLGKQTFTTVWEKTSQLLGLLSIPV